MHEALDTTVLIDSTTVIPEELIEERGVTVIPVPIYADGKEYRDGIDITPEEFYAILETSKQRPSTAVPGIGEFVSFYDRLLERYKKIVYPTPSSRLTGVFNAAVQSAKQVQGAKVIAIDPREESAQELYAVYSDDPQLEDRLVEIERLTGPLIAVMNTDYASGAAGMIAGEAIHAVHEGNPIDKVITRMIDAKRKTGIYFVLNTLEYVVDRVGELQAFLGTLLKIKPVLTMRNGYIVDAAKVRGERKARERMIELVKEWVGDKEVDVYVLHSLALQKAQDFLEQIRGELNVKSWYLGDIGSSVGRYTGRGGLAIVYKSC